MFIGKTKVYKNGDLWWVSYVIPYGGHLMACHSTWQEAMEDAIAVEKQKEWL